MKLVGEPITLTVIRTADVVRANQPSLFDRFHHVTVTGPQPKLGGWTFCAALDLIDVEGTRTVIVRTAPGETIPAQFRENAGHCDHCKLQRNRKTTYILKNSPENYISVGASCLADFLGHAAPEEVAQFFEYLSELGEILDEGENGSGGGCSFFSLADYLGYVAAAIRVDGWMSRTQVRNMNSNATATADTADQVMTAVINGKTKEINPKYLPTKVDFDRGNDCREFMQTFIAAESAKGELNDYLHNLSVICRMNAIDYKTSGIAASIIATAMREQGKEIERKKFANLKVTSKHFALVGEKITVRATLIGSREIEGQFGCTTMMRFVAEGNACTWFASGSFEPSTWELGTEYLIRGTVKKLDEYQGLKQTILTRVVVITQAVLDAEQAKAEKKAARAAKLLSQGAKQ